jgi:hypothetical protein
MNSRKSGSYVLLLALLIGTPLVMGAAKKGFSLRAPIRIDRDDRTIPQPKGRQASDIYAVLYNSWIRHLSLEEAFKKEVPSLNVNAWDEVPDSSWFTNRIGIRPLTFEEIVASLEGKPPQPQPWQVERRNDSGYTPKVDIHDATKQQYVLKFDPKGARERNSGAERIGTLIMHAAGYNVPHNSIVYFRLEDLRFDEDPYYRDPMGKRRPLTKADVDAVLKGLDPMPDGRYRGIASQRLPGITGLGPFMFTGRRKDDENDTIPHELRRELRGLRVISSWINHVDIKDNQALDMYQAAPDGRKFVKHHLIDFSATLGAYEWPTAPYRVGNEYMFDGTAMGKSLVTLGLWRRPWEVRGKVEHQEVGYFSSELFEPDKWKPSFPNLAFEQMEEGDGYWGAKIVTAFSDELIRKIAAAGEYSRPEVTAYVETVLRKRRDAVGAYWLNRVTPLEDIRLEGNRLQFRDLATALGFADSRSRDYRFHLETLDGKRLTPDKIAGTVEIPAPLPSQAVEQPADRYQRRLLLRVIIESRKNPKEWALPVEVVLGRVGTGRDLQVLGWTHAPD